MSMSYEITPLPREKYTDYPLNFRYETKNYYAPEIHHNENGFGAVFVKKAYDTPQIKEFTDKLYSPLWQGSEAFGVFSETDGERLIAAMEMWKAEHTNVMWINELWVTEECRRKGIGRLLIDFAKQKARDEKCRVLQLETHSNNENAVAFYFSQGFTFFGFEKALYTNHDIEDRRVCIELGMYLM